MRSLVAALEGNADLYDRYLARMKTAKTPEEYYNYFGALGQFPTAELAKRTMEFALGPDVKNQDLYLVAGPLQNVNTQADAWELFKGNFKAIMGKADASLGEGLARGRGGSSAMEGCETTRKSSLPIKIFLGPNAFFKTRRTE